MMTRDLFVAAFLAAYKAVIQRQAAKPRKTNQRFLTGWHGINPSVEYRRTGGSPLVVVRYDKEEFSLLTINEFLEMAIVDLLRDQSNGGPVDRLCQQMMHGDRSRNRFPIANMAVWEFILSRTAMANS